MEWLGAITIVPVRWFGKKIKRLAEWMMDAAWDRWRAERRASAPAPAAAAGTIHKVESHHQSGGITANTVNQAPAPELRWSPLHVRRNQDETFTITCTFDVVSPYPPAELSLQVEAAGIVSLDVMPERAGPFVTGPSGLRDGWGFTSVGSPSGRYTLTVVAAEPRIGIAPQFS